MVTAWVIKRESLRLNRVLTTIEFFGDKMTKADLEKHYSGNPDSKLISIKQVDPQIAWRVREKWDKR